MSDKIIKICGIKTPEAAITAARAGARYLGFVFFKKSPRFVETDAAADIITELKQACYEEGLEVPQRAGLFVDAGEKEIAEAAPFLSHFQFHGHEDAERIDELGREFGLETIKAIGVSGAPDFGAASEFAEAADMLLFDAKPPAGADRPGGHGDAFDWSVLSVYEGETPFLLAGGLTPDNVAGAIKAVGSHTAFAGVDVSSGVESAPGRKDLDKIAAFISAARA